jgi:hypothetical protein
MPEPANDPGTSISVGTRSGAVIGAENRCTGRPRPRDHGLVTLDPVRLVPCVINVDDTDTPADMIDALSLAAFTAGTQPHANGTRLDEVRADASLLPPGAVIVVAAWPRSRSARSRPPKRPGGCETQAQAVRTWPSPRP